MDSAISTALLVQLLKQTLPLVCLAMLHAKLV